MNSSSILFSLPTISNIGPDTAQMTTPSPDTIRMHEDDWRQIEFVGSKHWSTMNWQSSRILGASTGQAQAGRMCMFGNRAPTLCKQKVFPMLICRPPFHMRDLMIGTTGHEA
jgi:hypothetical protein